MGMGDARHIRRVRPLVQRTARSTNIRVDEGALSRFSQRPLCTVARMHTHMNTRTIRTTIAAAAVALAAFTAGACSSSSGSSAAEGNAQAAGKIDPKNFTAKIDNPYLPFKPGTTLRYRGFEHGRNVDVFTVTHRVKKIMGVPNVVIRDRLFRDGKVREDTLDWYTQDRQGTVWYFGEDTKEIGADGRVVSREGSWQAGLNGAKPGIFMPAHPQVGQSFRQEFYKGHAEDRFRIESLNASVKVPYGSFDNVVKTTETSPLEPGVIDSKFYARGVGQVKEASVKGPRETSVLVSVKKP